MNERGDDEFVVRTILERAGRGLQGVAQTAHPIPLQRMIQVPKGGEQAVRQCTDVFAFGAVQQRIVLAGAVLHPVKAHHPGAGCGSLIDFVGHLAVFTRVQVRVRMRSVAALASAARYSRASISAVGYSVGSLRIWGLTNEREAILSLP